MVGVRSRGEPGTGVEGEQEAGAGAGGKQEGFPLQCQVAR